MLSNHLIVSKKPKVKNRQVGAVKPKIAFLLSDQLGWKTYARQLLRVAEKREDVEIICQLYSFPYWAAPFLKWANSNKGTKLSKLKSKLDPIVFSQFHLKSWWKMLARDPQVISVHVASHILAAGAKKYTSLPYSVSLDATRPSVKRDLFDISWTDREIDREAEIFRSAAHIYPMSGWAENSVIKDFHCSSSRSTIMPPSGFVADFIESQSKFNHERPKVLFIGNDLKRKGGDKLIAWAKGHFKGRIELHIISQHLSKNIDDDTVKVHGSCSHATILNEILPTMDIFCLPTQQDMSPQVLMEASLSHIPSVVNDVGGVAEMIVDGETGYVVPKNSDNQFLNAMEKLISDKDLRMTMGRNARLFAEAKMDADKNFNRLIDNLLNFK